MLFNSIEFLFFLPITFILYWILQDKKLIYQNSLILFSSYFFYGWWDWKFLMLILLSTIIDYTIGIKLTHEKIKFRRKVYLWISLTFNLGILGFFKYYNFFLDNFIEAFTFAGVHIKANTLNIILPVGISFYTFQTLSYTIDVYNGKIKSTKDFIGFASFVSFFPQLVAGPIERAANLLPQFNKKRYFEYAKAVDGLKQILWGLFKKVVIADNCAEFANQTFTNINDSSGLSLVIGAIFFSFQIYGDFSGYSDIAIGTSRLFGFNLQRNFQFPYFSRNIAEFWRRWHISLSTWFRDYVYIPLGGSRVSMTKKIRNTFIIFLLSGFWHGANWTFIIWGALNAIYILPSIIIGSNRKYLQINTSKNVVSSLYELFNIILTFSITVFAWIFFRANSVTHALTYIKGIFNNDNWFSIDSWPLKTIFLVFIFFILEWRGKEEEFAIAKFGHNKHFTLRYLLFYAIIASIVLFGGQKQAFIYFQF